jgi:hypothetical protein
VAAPSSSAAPVPAAATAAARVLTAAAPAANTAPPTLAPQKPSATATAVAGHEAAASCRRQVFSVEIRPGETTIVSWKKLLKEAGHVAPVPQPAAEPALAAQTGLSDAVSSDVSSC